MLPLTGSSWNPGHPLPTLEEGMTQVEEKERRCFPLHVVTLRGHTDVARILLGRGVDVNAMGYDQNHGLCPSVVLAAWEGGIDVLRLLLEAGADPAICRVRKVRRRSGGRISPRQPGEMCRLLMKHGAIADLKAAVRLGDLEDRSILC